MRRIATVLTVAALVCTACHGAPPATDDPALTQCRDKLLTQFAQLEESLPEIIGPAEEAAGKLIAGGALYAAGDVGFVSEAVGRAGGLMMTRRLVAKSVLSPGDVVLIGAATNGDPRITTACRRARDVGAYVVLFSPAFEEPKADLASLCDAHVMNYYPDRGQRDEDAAVRTAPLSAVCNVTALWTFTAELVAALTRRGSVPVLWASISVPGGTERNAKYFVRIEPLKRRFHPDDDMAVPPQPAGRLGRAYLDALERQVSGLRGPVLEQLDAAAKLMADAVRAGHVVHTQTVSHFTAHEVRSVGVPKWISSPSRYRKPELLTGVVKPGDVYFELGYYDLRQPYLEAATRAGGKSVIALCHASTAPLEGPQADILIDAQWQYGDAVVLLPGYDAPILPTSGVLQTAVFWTVILRASYLEAP